MKKILIILALLSVSCKSKKIGTEPLRLKFDLGIDVNATISKIDSITDYYFVFVKNDKDFFKIISHRNQRKLYNGIKLKIGKNYKFRIEQITDRKPSGPDDKFTPVNYLDITRCKMFEGTKICTESSYELAKASNLIGLYLKKE